MILLSKKAYSIEDLSKLIDFLAVKFWLQILLREEPEWNLLRLSVLIRFD
jgi:hypothetical protein